MNSTTSTQTLRLLPVTALPLGKMGMLSDSVTVLPGQSMGEEKDTSG